MIIQKLEDRATIDQITDMLSQRLGVAKAAEIHNTFYTRYVAKHGTATEFAQTQVSPVESYVRREALTYFRYAYMCMYRHGVIQ